MQNEINSSQLTGFKNSIKNKIQLNPYNEWIKSKAIIETKQNPLRYKKI